MSFRHSLLSAASLLTLAAPATEAAPTFVRVATFAVAENGGDKATVAEIVAATPDGMMLVYTDSARGGVGMVDIADPKAPKPAGFIDLGGEPTSVAVVGKTALVAVSTGASKAAPAGKLVAVDVAGKVAGASCDLGGQPDSVAASKDGKTLAIAIENERDEEVNDGAIPQTPAGFVATVALGSDGAPDCASLKRIEMTGLAAVAGDDPEPEYVAVNDAGEIAVTLQENNAIVLLDAAGAVVAKFDAGAVSLDAIDATEEGVIAATGAVKDALREPDAIAWLDDDRFVTANEGDWKGGSRTITIFGRDGAVEWDSGAALEHLAMSLGHYPEGRAENKGVEPEGVATATFGPDRLIFVGMERASLVAVYRDKGKGEMPEFVEALSPSGVGPEGLLPIPSRDLFVTASETDFREDGGTGSVVTIFQRGEGTPAYPTIRSAEEGAGAIGWGALSGLAADPANAATLYAVSDSAYSEAAILTIDAAKTPAEITARTAVTEGGKPVADLDLEGIAVARDGGFWLASEGNPERDKNPTQSALLRVARDGAVTERIELPEALAAQATRYGFEGVAVIGAGDAETVWLAVQREWNDDPKGTVKLLAYRPATKAWGAVRYPLDPAGAGWVGLSELTADGDGLLVVERDNLIGPAAKAKKLFRVSLAGVTPGAIGSNLPTLAKTPVRDLLVDMAVGAGTVQDKIEGFAVAADGTAYAVTDNDGVDDASGETRFMRLGALKR